MKFSTFSAARPSSYLSRLAVASAATFASSDKIHLSLMSSRLSSGRPGSKSSGRFICTKREAFHSLLAKLRQARTFSSL